MTLSYSHQDRQCRRPSGSRSLVERVLRQSKAMSRMMHRWITAAKIRRLRNELLFRASYRDHWAEPYVDDHSDKSLGASQRPHILGEKWDY
jgi:hypothetical protein